MRISLPCLLVALMLPLSAGAEGVYEIYKKDPSEKSWTQRFLERVGYESGFSKSYALVVGISNFDQYTDLPTADDPFRMKDFLVSSGFDEVHLLTEDKVTQSKLSELMLDFFPSELDENDRFLLYWSGHGVERNNTRGGKTGYLPLAKSRKDEFSGMASMDDISRWDAFLNAQHVLYLVDACFSGLAGVVSKNDQTELMLDQMLKPARFLLAAGTGEEETIASDKWGGSLFTHALLNGLEGAADTSSKDFPSDGVISLFELISHIRRVVAVERDGRWPKPITPQIRDLRASNGEFFFLTGSPGNSASARTRSGGTSAVVPQSDPGVSRSTGRLTVSVNQPDAIVKIMNIAPRYYDGIELAMNEDFRIRVEKPGYQTHDEWIRIRDSDSTYHVEMMPESSDRISSDTSPPTAEQLIELSKNNPLEYKRLLGIRNEKGGNTRPVMIGSDRYLARKELGIEVEHVYRNRGGAVELVSHDVFLSGVALRDESANEPRVSSEALDFLDMYIAQFDRILEIRLEDRTGSLGDRNLSVLLGYYDFVDEVQQRLADSYPQIPLKSDQIASEARQQSEVEGRSIPHLKVAIVFRRA